MLIKFNLEDKLIGGNPVIFAFEKEAIFVPEILNEFADNLGKLIENDEFKGKAAEIYSLPVFNNDIKRIIIVGLGIKEKFKPVILSKVFGKLVKLAESKKALDLDLIYTENIKDSISQEVYVKNAVRYMNLASYKFIEFNTEAKKEAVDIESVNLINISDEVTKIIEEQTIISEATNYARHLNNLPSNKVTPQTFADKAKELDDEFDNLKVEIFDKSKMEDLGMGGLLGVSAGSQHEPKFIIFEYLNASSDEKPKVIVGKAITFDSGGISLKPGDKMDEMKMDMSGGGAILGAIKAICELDLKINVIGLIPSCENMPSGEAYKPGDILQVYNKKTIEVLNTDAEGRIILADALSYAKEYDPLCVVDLATLTGAVMVALGTERAGLFGNDQKYIDEFFELGEKNNELLWPMPLDDFYCEQIKSKIADVQNMGKSGRLGGSITAAAFLKEFVDYPWVHIDIAGTAWKDKPDALYNVGATGFGVNLLVEWLKK